MRSCSFLFLGGSLIRLHVVTRVFTVDDFVTLDFYKQNKAILCVSTRYRSSTSLRVETLKDMTDPSLAMKS